MPDGERIRLLLFLRLAVALAVAVQKNAQLALTGKQTRRGNVSVQLDAGTGLPLAGAGRCTRSTFRLHRALSLEATALESGSPVRSVDNVLGVHPRLILPCPTERREVPAARMGRWEGSAEPRPWRRRPPSIMYKPPSLRNASVPAFVSEHSELFFRSHKTDGWRRWGSPPTAKLVPFLRARLDGRRGFRCAPAEVLVVADDHLGGSPCLPGDPPNDSPQAERRSSAARLRIAIDNRAPGTSAEKPVLDECQPSACSPRSVPGAAGARASGDAYEVVGRAVEVGPATSTTFNGAPRRAACGHARRPSLHVIEGQRGNRRCPKVRLFRSLATRNPPIPGRLSCNRPTRSWCRRSAPGKFITAPSTWSSTVARAKWPPAVSGHPAPRNRGGKVVTGLETRGPRWARESNRASPRTREERRRRSMSAARIVLLHGRRFLRGAARIRGGDCTAIRASGSRASPTRARGICRPNQLAQACRMTVRGPSGARALRDDCAWSVVPNDPLISFGAPRRPIPARVGHRGASGRLPRKNTLRALRALPCEPIRCGQWSMDVRRPLRPRRKRWTLVPSPSNEPDVPRGEPTWRSGRPVSAKPDAFWQVPADAVPHPGSSDPRRSAGVSVAPSARLGLQLRDHIKNRGIEMAAVSEALRSPRLPLGVSWNQHIRCPGRSATWADPPSPTLHAPTPCPRERLVLRPRHGPWRR